MAAPDTATFSLQDLENSVMPNKGEGETNYNLKQCINIALGTTNWNVRTNYFDATAEAGASLYDLRGYFDTSDRITNTPDENNESLINRGASGALRAWRWIHYLQPQLWITSDSVANKLWVCETTLSFSNNVTNYYEGPSVPSISGWAFTGRISGWGEKIYLHYNNMSAVNGIPIGKAIRLEGYTISYGFNTFTISNFLTNFIVNPGTDEIVCSDLHLLESYDDSDVDIFITYYNETDSEWQGDFYEAGGSYTGYELDTTNYTKTARDWYTDGDFGVTRFGLQTKWRHAGWRTTNGRIPQMVLLYGGALNGSQNCEVISVGRNIDTKEGVKLTTTDLDFTGTFYNSSYTGFYDYISYPSQNVIINHYAKTVGATSNGGYLTTWDVDGVYDVDSFPL